MIPRHGARKCDFNMEEESQQTKLKQASFQLPATVTETPHRESIVHISSMPDNTLIGVGQDGLVSIWTSDLKMKKSRVILDENRQQNRKLKWITDSALMPHYNKLILGTCDREIRLYELSNFEPYCQIIGFETMPLRLDYSVRGDEECIILFGDEQGCVNIILVSSTAETLRNWSKCPLVDDIPSVSVDNIMESEHTTFIRWKVHNDWVTEVRYIHSIESIISSSNDDYTALVIGSIHGTINVQRRLKELFDSSSMRSKRSVLASSMPPKRASTDESLFKVQRGVKTFDFCKECNILVTGGLDRIIRLWNPYVQSWPTGLLTGHPYPIGFLRIADGNTRIYSVSMDCTVMVWSIEDQSCLFNVIPKASRIKGELAASFFSHELRALCIATDTLALLQLHSTEAPPSNMLVSHLQPVLCCKYIQLSRQVISCCEGSVLKLWDLETGQLVSEVSDAHVDTAVTCIALDPTENRLVTGGRDGSLKKWNCSNKTLRHVQTLKQASSMDEVGDCTYGEICSNRYIISVGWDRRIHIFPDQPDELVPEGKRSQSEWSNNMVNGHKEDILSVSACPPNLLATSSYDGEVLVWNLISGHILCHLHSLTSSELHNGTDDLIINKVIFLRSRTEQKTEAASLVASGPRGCITFWNISRGGKVFAYFPASSHKSVVSDLASTGDDCLLIASDQLGYVFIWHILEYALQGAEVQPPVLLESWRAHVCSITSVCPVNEDQLLLTSSMDCTVRLWSLKGEHIGTFGENEPWNIKEKGSWRGQSSQHHPDSQEMTSKLVSGANLCPEDGSEHENSSTETGTQMLDPLASLNDEDIAEELKDGGPKTAYRAKSYKLKQEELHHICGRLNAYQSLKLCELVNVSPAIRKPNPAAELNDPYDLAF
ncbi:cilia- and flagella-associated protein 337-like isoform X2 [Ambystoma mexicanum]|uniref:cilia- and flagella-associated protein 337-like isoform X2 n=1 Tax=Ambystoma mexicanum TaxID=8296 RepID=UPI0037E77EAE